MGAPIFTLIAFGGTWHLFTQYDSSPPHQHINLCCWYFATIWVDTTYDLAVLSHGVGISVVVAIG